jgi:hypothetical protein
MRNRATSEPDAGPTRGWHAASMAAALLLAACGGGGDGDGPETTDQASALGASTQAGAAGSSAACANRNNNTHAKLLECVTLAGVRSHQAALQAIADANNGTRVSGSPGFDQSATAR